VEKANPFCLLKCNGLSSFRVPRRASPGFAGRPGRNSSVGEVYIDRPVREGRSVEGDLAVIRSGGGKRKETMRGFLNSFPSFGTRLETRARREDGGNGGKRKERGVKRRAWKTFSDGVVREGSSGRKKTS